MQRQKRGVRLPVTALIFIIMWIILTMIITTAFGIKNKQHRDTIEIYEEYYEVNEEMDIIYRQWVQAYQHYSEIEYYLKFYPEVYLKYLELEKIIGEIKE